MDGNSLSRPDRQPGEGLSPRELQLLSLAAQGLTDNAISHRLGISLATVGTYWGRIRIKLGPLNRTELVANWLKDQAAVTVDQLKSDNEGLLSQLDEHTKTEEMLKTSLDLFRGLFETAPDAILLVNQQGRIELANVQAEEMFGYGSGELLGKPVDDLVPPDLRQQHVGNRDSYVENPIKRRMGEHLATDAIRRDGTVFRIATALSATPTTNGLLITCIIRDMTTQLVAPGNVVLAAEDH